MSELILPSLEGMYTGRGVHCNSVSLKSATQHLTYCSVARSMRARACDLVSTRPPGCSPAHHPATHAPPLARLSAHKLTVKLTCCPRRQHTALALGTSHGHSTRTHARTHRYTPLRVLAGGKCGVRRLLTRQQSPSQALPCRHCRRRGLGSGSAPSTKGSRVKGPLLPPRLRHPCNSFSAGAATSAAALLGAVPPLAALSTAAIAIPAAAAVAVRCHVPLQPPPRLPPPRGSIQHGC